MPELVYQLNMDLEQISSYKRTQLLKIMPLITMGELNAAKTAIANLKIEKTVQAQLLGLLASRVYRDDQKTGGALYDEAVIDSANCWLKTDQLRALGYIVEQQTGVKARQRARALVKQIATIIAGLPEPSLEPANNLSQLAACLSSTGANLFRAKFRRVGRNCFKLALNYCTRLPDRSEIEYNRKVRTYGELAKRYAEAGLFRQAVAAAGNVASRLQGGFTYENHEVDRSEVFRCIAIQLAQAKKRFQAKRLLRQASRIILNDVHNLDSVRTEGLIRIATTFQDVGFIKCARETLYKARFLPTGAAH